jgi:hypothetical protein
VNAWTLPDSRLLAAEHAYRRDTLRGATRPLPDVVGAVARLVGAVRRTLAAVQPSSRPAPAGRTTRTAAAALPPRDLPLGHSAMCR